MHRRMTLFVLAGLVIASPAAALAQADAKQAFELGRKAFEQGNYEAARDQFAKAAQTDVKNPEVFLWLGKAHYQLGELDEAITAWKTTVQLAPDNAFAQKMLKALRGQLLETDTAVQLVEILIDERLFPAALKECERLLQDRGLTDAQRVKVMTLQAAALTESGRAADALAVVRDLLVRYPKLADPAQTALLTGMAKLRMGGVFVREGLETLKKVLADHAGTPAAATAEYDLLRFALGQKADLPAAQAMEKWLKANPKHPKAQEGLRQVVEAYLAVTRESGPPSADAGPSESDVAALTAAVTLYERLVHAEEAHRLTGALVAHLDRHYAGRQAYRPAIALAEALLKAQLPPGSRCRVLHALARYQAELAMTLLTEQAKAGKLPAGPMPKVLADAAATCATINKEFPAKHAWGQLAALAERVRNLGGLLPRPAKVTQPKAPHAWALEIALPVVKANADTASVQKAVRTVTAIVDEYAKLPRPTGAKLALDVNARLLAAVSPDHAAWPPVVLKQIDLLDAWARQAFEDNLRTGAPEANAKLSETQKQLLAAMAGLVGREVRYAATVLGKLQSHLVPWVQHGHYLVAVDAYEQLARVLPEAQQRQCLLAVARVWIQQATAEHNRLLAGGLTVPRRLDPVLVKALERCYALQAGLEDRDPFGGEVRGVWDGIVAHYRALEYFDIAEQAILTRPEAKVPAADTYAELSLCRLHEE
ncbi:MAG TPA: tetratricopeptide repeat protein, partial [Phycisphaerae bacterium]|nr:tetratricopeptide repeat protein [Phycisphaerae bacterium]